jgi:peptide deformylase
MDEVAGEISEDEHDEQADAEAEVRKRMALAQIRQYPDPALRMRAREVEAFDGALVSLAERMAALMRDARGVGLAATQVGLLQRLFVFQHGEDELRVVVNPRIVEAGDVKEVDDEGCLSMQGVLVPVERPATVTLEGQDQTGAGIRLELEELPARIVQHELDHLDGVLILDRTTREGQREALRTLREQPRLG